MSGYPKPMAKREPVYLTHSPTYVNHNYSDHILKWEIYVKMCAYTGIRKVLLGKRYNFVFVFGIIINIKKTIIYNIIL